MANKSRQEELIDRLHANGLRKRVATAVTGGRGGRRKGEKRAREVLKQLEAASDTIRDEVLGRATKRSEAAKKAARTRKRNADKRSAAAKKGAGTRTKKSGNAGAKAGASRSRAKAASKR
ncbi:MAG TPA: hypothetical protein VGO71_04090 [Baekduia sp.]|jgi:hypothetical protein|nr:hypothetical protein [Baekduia sp.]